MLACLIEYFNGQSSVESAILYAVFISCLFIMNAISEGQRHYRMYRYGLQMRYSIQGLVYKKVSNCFNFKVYVNNLFYQNFEKIQLITGAA